MARKPGPRRETTPKLAAGSIPLTRLSAVGLIPYSSHELVESSTTFEKIGYVSNTTYDLTLHALDVERAWDHLLAVSLTKPIPWSHNGKLYYCRLATVAPDRRVDLPIIDQGDLIRSFHEENS